MRQAELIRITACAVFFLLVALLFWRRWRR
jgi:hypothetical protein